jgi:hypothetical protein
MSCIGEMRYAYNFFLQKPEEKRKLGGPRHRWENKGSLKLILEIGWEGADWIYLAQDRDQW